jgi:hypothetical protein
MGHMLRALGQRLDGIQRTFRELDSSLQLLGVLRQKGWQRSVRSQKPVDQNEDAIPWYTYSALDWLKARVKKSDVVFEYGAGYSTIWYGFRVKEVVAVEDDSRWLNHIRSLVGTNVTLLLRASSEAQPGCGMVSTYCGALEDYPPASFDIIAIDGKERVKCAHVAPTRLRKDGLIIFDNSDRPDFAPGIEYLHKEGFGRVDFYGFLSQMGASICTSVFSKSSSRWMNDNAPLVFQGW